MLIRKRWLRNEATGEFYRNGPLMLDDYARAISPFRKHRIAEEIRRAAGEPVVKAQLGILDVALPNVSFREQYPDDPRMWIFDGV
jgi:hypothetical protein